MLASKRKNHSTFAVVGLIILIIVLDLLGVFGIAKTIIVRGFGSDYSPTSYLGSGLNQLVDLYSNVSDLDRENKELIQENKKMLQQDFTCQDLEEENEELRKALLIPKLAETNKEFVQVFANPLYGNQGDFFINRGDKQGISEGAILIDSGSHYIGQISEVYGFYAKGVFASHWYPELPVRIAGKKIKGIVKADQNGWLLDMIPTDADLEVDDIVLLDGDDNLLKSNNAELNIIMGQLKEIVNEEKGIFTQGKIDPLVNYQDIQTAFVILEKE